MQPKTPNSRTTQEIDQNLRRVFREMEGESLPDRFTDLLAELRKQESGASAGSDQKDDTQ